MFLQSRKLSEEQKEAEAARKLKEEALVELAKAFVPYEHTDDHKCANAGYYGGFQLLDKEL